MNDEDWRRMVRAKELHGKHRFLRVQCAVDGIFYDAHSGCCGGCGAKLKAEGDVE